MRLCATHMTTALGWACAVLLAASVAAGCHRAFRAPEAEWSCSPDRPCGKCPKCKPRVDACADIPQGAIPQPVGTYVNAHLATEAEKANRTKFVIFWNEFLADTAEPGPYGSTHLQRIADQMALCPYPVIIQPEFGRPELNEARRETVVALLTAARVPHARQRVVIGFSAAEGLFGEEAERIYPQLIRGGFSGGNLGGFGNGLGGAGLNGFGNLGGLGLNGFGGFGGLGGFGLGGFGGFR